MNKINIEEKDSSTKRLIMKIIEIPFISILLRSKLNIKESYRNLRAFSLIKSSILFDTKYYLERTPTLKKTPMNPIVHYLYYGYKENKNPSEKFNTNYYLKKYENVEKIGINPLVHYLLYGKKEGKYPRKKEESESPEKLVRKIETLRKKVEKLNTQIEELEIPINQIDKELISYEIEILKNESIANEKRTPEIIISLTTSSNKIYKIHYTIYSLLKQSIKADRILLWLSKEEFPNLEKDLPENLKNLTKYGLSIEWCENLKSYQKLIPSLKKYPDEIIITANDNIFYPENWLEQLYNDYDEKNIVAHRIKEVKTNIYGKLIPSSWKIEKSEENYPSIMNFPDGDGGVLYPPNSFSANIFNEKIFLNIDNSDLWFWAMAVTNNKKIKAVENDDFNLKYVDLPEECIKKNKELKNKNKNKNIDKNIEKDVNSINTLLIHYPEILEKIKEEMIPKVSVIILFENSEKYIEQCLFSVINQTLIEIDIVCVNNGCDDNSLNILEKFSSKDKRINLLKQDKQPPYIACNNGLKYAKGEYAIFLSSNDWLEVKTLENLYLSAEENDSEVVFFKTKCFNNDKDKIKSWNYYKTTEIENMYKKKIITNKTIEKNIFKLSTNVYDKFYKTSLLTYIQAKFYENDNLTNNSFNYSVFLNISKISIVAKELYFHRTNENNDDNIPIHYTKIIERLNQEINIFKNNNAYSKYLKNLLNHKIEKIRKSYYKIPKKDKKKYLNLIKKDFNKIKNNNTKKNEYIENLNKQNLQFYLNIAGSKLKDGKKSKTKDFKNDFTKKTDPTYSNRKKALIIEPNNFHVEIIPTYAKYLIELDYDLDIIMMKKIYEMEPLERFKNDRIHVCSFTHEKLTEFLSSSHNLEKYDIILFTSHKDYIYSDEKDNMSVFKIFPVLNIPKIKNKTIAIEHNFLITKHLEELLNNNHILTLTNLGYDDIVVNHTFYGNIEVTNKNIDKTVFIMVGNLETKRRNWDFLIDAVFQLDQKGYNNFKVVVVGSGDFGDVPLKVRKYFEIRGRISYPDMYSSIEKADFILPMLNPENPEHDRYLNISQSGSFLLMYGFKKPGLVSEKFASRYGINEDNSIIYEKNVNLKEAMEKAILMDREEYEKLQTNLTELVKEIDKKSFENFQRIVNITSSK